MLDASGRESVIVMRVRAGDESAAYVFRSYEALFDYIKMVGSADYSIAIVPFGDSIAPSVSEPDAVYAVNGAFYLDKDMADAMADGADVQELFNGRRVDLGSF